MTTALKLGFDALCWKRRLFWFAVFGCSIFFLNTKRVILMTAFLRIQHFGSMYLLFCKRKSSYDPGTCQSDLKLKHRVCQPCAIESMSVPICCSQTCDRNRKQVRNILARNESSAMTCSKDRTSGFTGFSPFYIHLSNKHATTLWLVSYLPASLQNENPTAIKPRLR